MAKLPTQCVGCKFASWHTTSNGRLHPKGEGRCTWTLPDITIPIAFHYSGFGDNMRRLPRPSGGHIDRYSDGKPEPICAQRRNNT